MKIMMSAGEASGDLHGARLAKEMLEMEPEAARAFFGLKDGERAALLLPGSRRQEVSFLLPDMLRAVQILKEKRPETRFFLPVAQGLERQEIERHIEKSGACPRTRSPIAAGKDARRVHARGKA